MFEKSFKNIDNILHNDAGCSSELDYVEQTSWVLFLKYLDNSEKENAIAAKLDTKSHTNIIKNTDFQWEKWAAPKLANGKIDHNALTGDDLIAFINEKLFPYLKNFKSKADNSETIEYKIGVIFNELKNKIQSGYNLREIIKSIDELRFETHAEKHEMSHLYEGKIKNMGNAGRSGGEYYTSRPLIKTIIKIVKPKIGNKIYDGAAGSAGFLVEAFNYLNPKNLPTRNIEILKKTTFYGQEKKSLIYIIGIMNMILHGIKTSNIRHTNTLTENIADFQESDRVDIILANPPCGASERKEIQQNFPIRTGETAYLFLQHFIKKLKVKGVCGVVIKNTFLSNTDQASTTLRKQLLEECDLFTVLDLPGGVFFGAGVKTVVLFFKKGVPTKEIWYYQLNLDRKIGKTTPLSEQDLAEFIELEPTKKDSENSWKVAIADIDKETLDLTANNPNLVEEIDNRTPSEIIAEIDKLSLQAENSITKIKDLI